MLKGKRFAKKTKRGAVIHVNREHYLRDDIWCGVSECTTCKHDRGVLSTATTILCPDTNVALHQMDLLEHPKITNVILLSTVLDEVKHRSKTTYDRLRSCVDNPDKHFYVFTNEHRRGLYLEQAQGESVNDRNDRAIRVAAEWYVGHVATLNPAAAPLKEGKGKGKKTNTSAAAGVVLLTDDDANCKLAAGLGLASYKVREYATAVLKDPELIDRIAHAGSADPSDLRGAAGGAGGGGGAGAGAASGTGYTAYLAPSEVTRGLKAGDYAQGTFHRSKENSTEGYVSVSGQDRQVLVKGADINRAIDRDIVCVQVYKQSEWSAPSGVVEREGAEGAGALPTDHGTDDIGFLQHGGGSSGSARPTAKVVAIVKRNWRPYCGALMPPRDGKKASSAASGGQRVLFAPGNRQIPPIRINTRQAAALEGMRIIVSIDSWPVESKHPLGHYVRTLGKIGDADVETEVVLIEHGIPYQPFSAAVLAEMPSVPWTVPPSELEKRTDFRDLNVCSIDPPGCTDIDDALHVRPLENGNYECGVHIADVSHFIRPGSLCDQEAAKRGTTVYLTNRRIDMVPPVLSGNLCSLRSGVERLALSTVWEVTPEADVVSVRFCKSVIASKFSFMYSEAQARIDDVNDSSECTEGLRVLNSLAKQLRQKRLDKGALMLASPEVRFNMQSETHDPIDVEVKQAMETNSLVEEFMLLANVTTAAHTYKHFPECAMLRRHPTPPGTNFEPLILAAKGAGVDLDTSSSLALAQSLEKASSAEKGHQYTSTLLRILATRCMLQAQYFCSGTQAEEDFRHYGLASDIYTHFTSPIRRYSDVIAHRLLAASIGVDSTYADLVDKDKTAKLTDNLNHRHTMAQHASRASTDLFSQIFFKDKVVDEEAFVLRVRKNAVTVLVPRYGIEGPVYLEEKVKDGAAGAGAAGALVAAGPAVVYDEESQTVTAGSQAFRVFDRVVVQISVETFLQSGVLRLKLVSPAVRGLSVAPQESTDEGMLSGAAFAAKTEARGKQLKTLPAPDAKRDEKEEVVKDGGGAAVASAAAAGGKKKKSKKKSKKKRVGGEGDVEGGAGNGAVGSAKRTKTDA